MNDEEINLEEEAFKNIQSFLRGSGKHNFELSVDDDGITLENEKLKYRIEKNHSPFYEGTYGLKIFRGNDAVFFNKRPSANGTTYDELYTLLTNVS